MTVQFNPLVLIALLWNENRLRNKTDDVCFVFYLSPLLTSLEFEVRLNGNPVPILYEKTIRFLSRVEEAPKQWKNKCWLPPSIYLSSGDIIKPQVPIGLPKRKRVPSSLAIGSIFARQYDPKEFSIFPLSDGVGCFWARLCQTTFWNLYLGKGGLLLLLIHPSTLQQGGGPANENMLAYRLFIFMYIGVIIISSTTNTKENPFLGHLAWGRSCSTQWKSTDTFWLGEKIRGDKDKPSRAIRHKD